MAAWVVMAGVLAACAADDPLAQPLNLPTMPPPQSPQTPLPSYVERLDKPAITVTIDAPGKCADATGACK
jgi:hypothetical protein